MVIVKNVLLFLNQYTFAMYRPRVHSLSTVIKPALKTEGCTSWSIHSLISQAFNALKVYCLVLILLPSLLEEELRAYLHVASESML